MSLRVRMPDLEKAVKFFALYPELETDQIKELFNGKICDTSVVKLKNMARKQMAKDNTATFSKTAVNTDSAYRAWNLDIKALEARYKRLMKMEEVG